MKITKNQLISVFVFLLLIFVITSNDQLESWIKYKLMSLAEKDSNAVNDDFATNSWYVDVNANFPDKSKIEKREESLFFEIPTKNSFYLTYGESKFNIFDRQNPSIRKLILQIDPQLIIYNKRVSEGLLTEAFSDPSGKGCFEFLFHQKHQIENLNAIRICPNGAKNSAVLNKIKQSILKNLEKLYNESNELNAFEKFRFKSVAEKSSSLSKVKGSSRQISLVPGAAAPFPQIPLIAGASPLPTTNTISLAAPALPLVSNVLSPVPAVQAIGLAPATPVAQVLDFSNMTKNINCVLKECFVYYSKNSSSNKIIAPFSSPIKQIGGDFIPVKITLNTNHLVVRLSDNAEILRFQLIEIEAVQKSQMNPNCFNIFDVMGNKFKFCQMENMVNCSADNWITDINGFKNQCADSFALTDASFETIVIPSSMSIGINASFNSTRDDNGKNCDKKGDDDDNDKEKGKKKKDGEGKDKKKKKSKDSEEDEDEEIEETTEIVEKSHSNSTSSNSNSKTNKQNSNGKNSSSNEKSSKNNSNKKKKKGKNSESSSEESEESEETETSSSESSSSSESETKKSSGSSKNGRRPSKVKDANKNSDSGTEKNGANKSNDHSAKNNDSKKQDDKTTEKKSSTVEEDYSEEKKIMEIFNKNKPTGSKDELIINDNTETIDTSKFRLNTELDEKKRKFRTVDDSNESTNNKELLLNQNKILQKLFESTTNFISKVSQVIDKKGDENKKETNSTESNNSTNTNNNNNQPQNNPQNPYNPNYYNTPYANRYPYQNFPLYNNFQYNNKKFFPYAQFNQNFPNNNYPYNYNNQGNPNNGFNQFPPQNQNEKSNPNGNNNEVDPDLAIAGLDKNDPKNFDIIMRHYVGLLQSGKLDAKNRQITQPQNLAKTDDKQTHDTDQHVNQNDPNTNKSLDTLLKYFQDYIHKKQKKKEDTLDRKLAKLIDHEKKREEDLENVIKNLFTTSTACQPPCNQNCCNRVVNTCCMSNNNPNMPNEQSTRPKPEDDKNGTEKSENKNSSSTKKTTKTTRIIRRRRGRRSKSSGEDEGEGNFKKNNPQQPTNKNVNINKNNNIKYGDNNNANANSNHYTDNSKKNDGNPQNDNNKKNGDPATGTTETTETSSNSKNNVPSGGKPVTEEQTTTTTETKKGDDPKKNGNEQGDQTTETTETKQIDGGSPNTDQNKNIPQPTQKEETETKNSQGANAGNNGSETKSAGADAKKVEDAKKNDPNAKKADEAKKNDANAKKADEAKKNDANAKKNDANANKNDANAKKSDANAKKNDANAKKSDANAKKNDANAKKADANAKKNDPNAKKNDANAKKNDANAKKADANPKNNDANAKKEDANAKKNDPNAKKNLKDGDKNGKGDKQAKGNGNKAEEMQKEIKTVTKKTEKDGKKGAGSKLDNFMSAKELMKRLEVCFTDDGGKMMDYYNTSLKNPELKKYCLSSWTFCYICCKNEMSNDQLGEKCCKERCDIKLHRILHVSIGCVNSHANMLKLDDYVPQYYKDLSQVHPQYYP